MGFGFIEKQAWPEGNPKDGMRLIIIVAVSRHWLVPSQNLEGNWVVM
jgi:hypothetical protein